MPASIDQTSYQSSQSNINALQGPLASLYRNNNKLDTILQYPSDLGSPTKNHYVKFWVKQIIPQNATVTTTTTNESVKSGTIAQPGTGQTLGTFNIQPQQTKPVACISLYMPDTLNATYNASYDELSLTNELGKNLGNLQAISNFLGGAGKNKNSASGVASDASVNYGTSKVLGNIASVAGADAQGISDINLQGGGFTVNPQLQVLYRGIGFRQFQLSFLFTPASHDEALTVNKIIAAFKYHFAPDLLTASQSDNGMFFIPPSYFSVEFMINNQENVYLPKYGDCVLADIDVNYAPNGFAAHTDGAPVQTQLNLVFKEIEIVTKGKLQAGYNIATSDGSSGSIGGLR